MMECMTEKASPKENTVEKKIIETEKKKERVCSERSGEKFLKGHPGFGLSSGP